MRPLLAAFLGLSASAACAADGPAVAVSDGPWLTGVWGNAAGCAYHKGGSRDADDTLVVLKPDGLETYVTECEFLSVQRGTGASVVTALCGHEGEDVLTAETFIVRDPWEPEARTKRLTDGDGNLRDEVSPCD